MSLLWLTQRFFVGYYFAYYRLNLISHHGVIESIPTVSYPRFGAAHLHPVSVFSEVICQVYFQGYFCLNGASTKVIPVSVYYQAEFIANTIRKFF